MSEAALSLLEQGMKRSINVRAVIGSLPTDACVQWPGTLDRQGYGVIASRVTRSAHRYIYIALHGIPDLPELDHLCHSRSDCTGGPICIHRRCINPAHLEPVTTAENGRRRIGAKICPNGHLRTPDNLYTYRIANKIKQACRACRRASDQRRNGSR